MIRTTREFNANRGPGDVEDSWFVEFSGIESYRADFGELGLDEVVTTVSRGGRALSLGSYGVDLVSANVRGTAVSLSDKRTPEMKSIAGRVGVNQIVGDVLDPETWKRMEDDYELVLNRSAGGMDVIPFHLRGVLLRRAYEKLRPGGTLFTELRNTSIISPDMRQVEGTQGVRVSYKASSPQAMRIDKGEDAPDRLPVWDDEFVGL